MIEHIALKALAILILGNAPLFEVNWQALNPQASFW